MRIFARRYCGLTKNLSRDTQVLMKILSNIKSIQGVIKNFRCDYSQTQQGLYNNQYAFDLCAFYMAQIGEKMKLLTDETYANLNKVVSLQNIQYFRNMIDHDYDNINKVMLQAYIQQVASPQFVDCIKNRINYCIHNKKE